MNKSGNRGGVGEMSRENLLRQIDGWDVGILVCIKRRNAINHPSHFNTLNGELIAEMGWLKEDDFKNRLKRLEDLGLIEDVSQCVEAAYWLTSEGKELVK